MVRIENIVRKPGSILLRGSKKIGLQPVMHGLLTNAQCGHAQYVMFGSVTD